MFINYDFRSSSTYHAPVNPALNLQGIKAAQVFGNRKTLCSFVIFFRPSIFIFVNIYSGNM